MDCILDADPGASEMPCAWRVFTNSSGSLVERMRVNSTGEVGIGMVARSGYALDVNGNIGGNIIGNASTATTALKATALATTPTTCASGTYAIGVAANGNAVCSNPSRYIWSASYGGNINLNYVMQAMTFDYSITVTRVHVTLGTPGSCTTYPGIVVTDGTHTVTVPLNGTGSADSGTVRVGLSSGVLSSIASIAGICSTNPSNVGVSVQYGMTQ